MGRKRTMAAAGYSAPTGRSQISRKRPIEDTEADCATVSNSAQPPSRLRVRQPVLRLRMGYENETIHNDGVGRTLRNSVGRMTTPAPSRRRSLRTATSAPAPATAPAPVTAALEGAATRVHRSVNNARMSVTPARRARMHTHRVSHIPLPVSTPAKRPRCVPQGRTAESEKPGYSMLLRAAAKKLPGPCRYASSGCPENVVPVDMEKHAVICDYRPYHCPLSDNCHWKGELNEVLHHLLKSHPDIKQLRGPNSHMICNNVKKVAPTEWISIQTCLGQNFLVSVQKLVRDGHPQFFGTVKIIGSKEDADRFDYKLSLTKPDVSRKAVSYSTIVGTVRNGSQAIVDKDCLVCDQAYFELFSVKDCVVIEISISVMKI